MPLADYKCNDCGEQIYDHFRLLADPRPQHCGKEMEWVPSFSRGRSMGFVPFELEMDGEKKRFSSIQDVRNHEAESLRKHANGEGSPTIFRAFNQDKSNYDVNVFGPSPQQGPPKRLNHRGKPFITRGDHRGGE